MIYLIYSSLLQGALKLLIYSFKSFNLQKGQIKPKLIIRWMQVGRQMHFDPADNTEKNTFTLRAHVIFVFLYCCTTFLHIT